MSTVTAVQKNGLICMASESLTTFGPTKLPGEFLHEGEKIIEWGNSLVGVVGSVSLNMVLRDIFMHDKKPPVFQNSMEVFTYFKKLHPKLKEEYFLNTTEEDEETPVESSQLEIILANPHGLFGIHSLRDIYHFRQYWAYGSGRFYALGAMQAVYDLPEFDAEAIARAGVQAGITFDDGSDGEIDIRTIKMK